MSRRVRVVNAVLRSSLFVLLGLLTGRGSASLLEVWPDGHGTYPNIRSAVVAAVPGDTVMLGDGIFRGADNHNILFLGKSIMICSRSNDPDRCKIDCTPSGRDVVERGFAFIEGEDAGAVLRGLTVMNGMVFGNICPPAGAGVWIIRASPTIENCVFRDCSAGTGAGLASSNDSSPTVSDCVFENNTSTEGPGGAIYIGQRATSHFYRCRITGNSGTYGGGGVVTYDDSRAYFQDCEFRGNTAESGGCLDASGGVPVFDHCLFDGNSSHQGGVFLTEGKGSARFQFCTFVNNASGAGGIGYIRGSGYITNCTFYGNSSYDGLFSLENGDVAIDHTIFCHSTRGSDVYCWGDSHASVSCSDFYDSAWGDWIWCIADQFDGLRNVSVDPLFCAPEEGDFRLQPFSWCAPGHNPGCGLVGAWGGGCTSGVPESATSPASALLTVTPNPGRGHFRLEWSSFAGRNVSVEVFDVNGRRVRSLRSIPAGARGITWNGSDASGRLLTPGVYLVRAADGTSSAQTRVVLVQ